MRDNLTPFEVCERLIGPPPVLAEVIGYDRTATYGYRYAAKGRDAGDFPSARIMRALLAHSQANGLGLTAEHLITGATEAEIEAVLADREALTDAAFASRRNSIPAGMTAGPAAQADACTGQDRGGQGQGDLTSPGAVAA